MNVGHRNAVTQYICERVSLLAVEGYGETAGNVK